MRRLSLLALLMATALAATTSPSPRAIAHPISFLEVEVQGAKKGWELEFTVTAEDLMHIHSLEPDAEEHLRPDEVARAISKHREFLESGLEIVGDDGRAWRVRLDDGTPSRFARPRLFTTDLPHRSVRYRGTASPRATERKTRPRAAVVTPRFDAAANGLATQLTLRIGERTVAIAEGVPALFRLAIDGTIATVDPTRERIPTIRADADRERVRVEVRMPLNALSDLIGETRLVDRSFLDRDAQRELKEAALPRLLGKLRLATHDGQASPRAIPLEFVSLRLEPHDSTSDDSDTRDWCGAADLRVRVDAPLPTDAMHIRLTCDYLEGTLHRVRHESRVTGRPPRIHNLHRYQRSVEWTLPPPTDRSR